MEGCASKTHFWHTFSPVAHFGLPPPHPSRRRPTNSCEFMGIARNSRNITGDGEAGGWSPGSWITAGKKPSAGGDAAGEKRWESGRGGPEAAADNARKLAEEAQGRTERVEGGAGSGYVGTAKFLQEARAVKPVLLDKEGVVLADGVAIEDHESVSLANPVAPVHLVMLLDTTQLAPVAIVVENTVDGKTGVPFEPAGVGRKGAELVLGGIDGEIAANQPNREVGEGPDGIAGARGIGLPVGMGKAEELGACAGVVAEELPGPESIVGDGGGNEGEVGMGMVLLVGFKEAQIPVAGNEDVLVDLEVEGAGVASDAFVLEVADAPALAARAMDEIPVDGGEAAGQGVHVAAMGTDDAIAENHHLVEALGGAPAHEAVDGEPEAVEPMARQNH